MVGPDARVTVRLQFEPYRARRRPGISGLDPRGRAEQILDMVPILVSEHVGVGEQAALRTKLGLQVLIEAHRSMYTVWSAGQ